jgi:hypothetical protein
MNRNLIIVGIVVLGLAGVGGFLLTRNNSDANSQSTRQSTNQQTQNAAAEESSQQGNLATLRSGGAARECTMSYSDSNGSGNGKMYTDGKGRGRMTLDINTARGNQAQSNTLMLNDKVYSWTKTDGQSMGFVFDASTVQTNSTASPSTSNSQSAGKNFDLKCKSWKVDENVLTVPTDVTFTTLSTGQ